MSTFHEIITQIISGTTYLMQVHKSNRILAERPLVLSTRETLHDLRLSFSALIESALESKRLAQSHYFTKSAQARQHMDLLSKKISARDALRAEMHGADLGVHMMKGVDHGTLKQFTLDQSFGFANVFTEMEEWLGEARREYEGAVGECEGIRGEIEGLVLETERADEEVQARNGEWMMLVQQMEIFGPFMKYAIENVEAVLEMEGVEVEDVFELEAVESPLSPGSAKDEMRKSTYVPFRPVNAEVLEAPESPSTPPTPSIVKKKTKYTPYRATASKVKQPPKYFTNRPLQRDPLRKRSLAEERRRQTERGNADLLYNKQLDAMEAAHKAIAASQEEGRIVSGDGRVGFRGGKSSEMSMWF